MSPRNKLVLLAMIGVVAWAFASVNARTVYTDHSGDIRYVLTATNYTREYLDSGKWIVVESGSYQSSDWVLTLTVDAKFKFTSPYLMTASPDGESLVRRIPAECATVVEEYRK